MRGNSNCKKGIQIVKREFKMLKMENKNVKLTI